MAQVLPKEIKETNINYVDVDDVVSVTTFQRKYINKLKALAEKYPEEVRIIAENSDGTAVFSLPKKYVHISFGERSRREMTEDQKDAARERLEQARGRK